MLTVFERLQYAPTKQQQAFHDSCRFHESEVIFVSERACGKTTAMFMEALKNASSFPGIRILMAGGSRSFWLSTIQVWNVEQKLGALFHATTLKLVFSNGSSIRFDPYVTTKEKAQQGYAGMELHEIFFDQPYIDREAQEVLESCLRTSKSDVPVLGTRRAEDGTYGIYLRHPFR